jgi:transcriptional regulator with PAS, ATPase and Fis domain
MSKNSCNTVELITEHENVFHVDNIIPMRTLQDMYMNWVMAKCDYDKDVVAKRLRISRKTVYNRCKYGQVQDSR